MPRVLPIAAVWLFAVLLSAPAAHAAFPGANGKIAFHTNRDGGNFDIYVMNANGSSPTRLTTHTAADLTPAWSPDGTKIAFVSDRDGNNEIYTMNADGTSQTRLTISTTSDDVAPAWSADGTKIAFATNRDGNFEIYTITSTGAAPTRLTTNSAIDTQPAWSPNDDKIAFATNRDGNFEIYTMSTTGSGPANITNASIPETEPNWSPNGAYIAYQELFASSYEVFFNTPAGVPSGTIAATSSNETEPAWSPDNKVAVIADDHNGDYEICSQVISGAPLQCATPLTTNTAADQAPDWQPLVSAHARPNSANKITMALVPAYAACSASDVNSKHRGTVSSSGCTPPKLESNFLTVGSQSDGSVSMKVICVGGATGEMPPCLTTSGDQLDGKIDVSIDDVRCQGTSGGCAGAQQDYTNSLLFETSFRVTDRNFAAGTTSGTITPDYAVRFSVPCATTVSTTVGSTCSVSTSIDAAIGGNTAITEQKRAIWRPVGDIRLFDGGADGSAASLGDNTLYAAGGLFFP